MVTGIGGMVSPTVGGMGGVGGASEGAATGKDFASFIRDAGNDAVATMYQGETMSKAGIEGTADLNDVVAAVNDAELTLQTITTLRDRLVQAYQEIIRMPI
jgi:flagellar hook-basal body complex protein FliE